MKRLQALGESKIFVLGLYLHGGFYIIKQNPAEQIGGPAPVPGTRLKKPEAQYYDTIYPVGIYSHSFFDCQHSDSDL